MGVQCTLIQEMTLRAKGFRLIAGVDEAGRGPLAGPVVAAAVILPLDTPEAWISGIRDSKQLSAAARDRLFEEIRGRAISVGVEVIGAGELDSIGLGPAYRLAMCRAVSQLQPAPDYALVDGYRVPELGLLHEGVIKGDELCLSIAAASVIAKVTRDRLMIQMDERFPGYGFARHKGYGTDEHLRCLQSLGPCPIHRRSFAPVAAVLRDEK